MSRDNGGISNRKGGNMSQRDKVFGAIPISDPEAFLTGLFESGIISLTLGSESIEALKTKAFPVNRHSVV